MSLAPIVTYSGYARAGKTTFINPALELLGYEVLSTSVILHQFAQKVADSLFNQQLDTLDKSNTLHMQLIDNTGLHQSTMETRDFLITLAESCIVPVFGRSCIVRVVATKASRLLSEGKLVAIETIGGSEYNLLLDLLSEEGINHADIVEFNVRREGELAGVDVRELIPYAVDIENNDTFEALKDKLYQHLYIF